MLNLVPKSVGKDIFFSPHTATNQLENCFFTVLQKSWLMPKDKEYPWRPFTRLQLWYTGKVPEFVKQSSLGSGISAWEGFCGLQWSCSFNCYWLFCRGSLGHRLCVNHHCKWILLSNFSRCILWLSPNRKCGARLVSALEWVVGTLYPDFPCNWIPADGKVEQVYFIASHSKTELFTAFSHLNFNKGN